MANTLRIKRRASGSPGAPTSLANAELAFNEVDNTLYYGKGTGGVGGTASTVEAIGGSGAYLTLSTAQNISGNKTFTGDIIVPTQASGDDSTKAASTAFVKAQNYLTGNQSITISGDASGTGTTSITLTLASVGTSGTYTKVTTDSKGRVTSGTTLIESDIPSLTASKISDFDTQVRTNRLDQLTAPSASVSFNSQKITSLADPTNAQDAATKAYVDATKQGLDVKDSVRAATTGDITLSGTQTIDGVSLVAGNRVLVKNQNTASENGIYDVVSGGSWTRSADANVSSDVTSGMFVFVEEGTANADSGWVLTTDGAITLDSTALAFTQFSGAGQITAGAGLSKTGNTIDVGTASATRIVVNADNIDLATTGVSGGTYKSVTVDAYGRVTAGTNPTTLSGYGITDAQPLDATLTALAGVTVSADQLIYATGSDTFTTTSFTSFGRSLVDDADASAARTTLGLGTIATQNANNVSITGGSIDNIEFDGGTF
jgi:phage-related tail fiber protein